MTSILPENITDENRSANYVANFFKEHKIVLPLTQFDAAILTANNGRNIATIRHNAKN